MLNRTQWDVCEQPPGVVYWNVTLFSLLVAVSCLEILLCGVQVVNATMGVFCGDCRKKEVGWRGEEGVGAAQGTCLLPGCVLTFSSPQGSPH